MAILRGSGFVRVVFLVIVAALMLRFGWRCTGCGVQIIALILFILKILQILSSLSQKFRRFVLSENYNQTQPA